MGTRPGLQLHDIVCNKLMSIHLKVSKTDQMAKGTFIHIEPTNDGYCPIAAMKAFLELRSKTSGPLFIHKNGRIMNRVQFQSVLNKCTSYLGWETSKFTTHSFRIGAATSAALKGVPDETIMLKGRWTSSAMHKYIRC